MALFTEHCAGAAQNATPGPPAQPAVTSHRTGGIRGADSGLGSARFLQGFLQLPNVVLARLSAPVVLTGLSGISPDSRVCDFLLGFPATPGSVLTGTRAGAFSVACPSASLWAPGLTFAVASVPQAHDGTTVGVPGCPQMF